MNFLARISPLRLSERATAAKPALLGDAFVAPDQSREIRDDSGTFLVRR